MPPSLPDELAPMLCRIGQPCDSDQHLYEVKWDGIRAIAFVDGGTGPGYRLQSRHRADLISRYPELELLGGLPPGTVLDGELVVLQADGRPDFAAVLARENAGNPARIAQNAATRPVVYVVFDLLYRDFEPLLDVPLSTRRQQLAELMGTVASARLVMSEAVVGRGLELFAAVKQQGLEGMVQKRLDSRYRPGSRSDNWLKIKPVKTVQCAILGFQPDGDRDFKSLIIASDLDGELRCVGRVGAGFSVAVKQRVWRLLCANRRSSPWLEAGMSGSWVEPGLYCSVSYLERTASGSLRGPVFVDLIEG